MGLQRVRHDQATFASLFTLWETGKPFARAAAPFSTPTPPAPRVRQIWFWETLPAPGGVSVPLQPSVQMVVMSPCGDSVLS